MNILNPFDWQIDAVRKVYSYLTRIYFFRWNIHAVFNHLATICSRHTHINKVLTDLLPPRNHFIFNKPVWEGVGKVYRYSYFMSSQSVWIGDCCPVEIPGERCQWTRLSRFRGVLQLTDAGLDSLITAVSPRALILAIGEKRKKGLARFFSFGNVSYWWVEYCVKTHQASPCCSLQIRECLYLT